MKSASLICSELATKPRTSTCASLPKITPLGLSKNTCPLALTLPMIWVASPAATRFKMVELALGWSNRTVAAEPTSKLSQLMTAAELLCLTVRLAPAAEMVAVPAATCPPVGKVFALGGAAITHWGSPKDMATAKQDLVIAGSSSGSNWGQPTQSRGCRRVSAPDLRRTMRLTEEPNVPQPRAHSLTATQQLWALFQTIR